jgi:ADP-ribose pyrophosphatase YjhB (NUDIX family)
MPAKSAKIAKSADALQHVDVSVVLLEQDGRFLVVWNDKWGSFGLPMTKRRTMVDPDLPDTEQEETWVDAAIRAAAECLGRTLTQEPRDILSIPQFERSQRDARWKRYSYHVFLLKLEGQDLLAGGKVTQWLTMEELGNLRRRPISETVRQIVAELKFRKLP